MGHTDQSQSAVLTERLQTLANAVIDHLYETGRVRRALTAKQQADISASVQLLVVDGLRSAASYPPKTTPICKSQQSYTSTHPDYRGVPYRMHVERVYPALVELGYLRVEKRGWFDRTTREGRREQYAVTAQLIDWLVDQSNTQPPHTQHQHWSDAFVVRREVIPKTHPILITEQSLGSNRRRRYLPSPTPETMAIERSVERINERLSRHWLDLDLTEVEWRSLGKAISGGDDSDRCIDLTQRRLTRIFHDPDLTTGGRFYGGWWQGLPKSYRGRLLIDGKRTTEWDYSGIHPTLLYAKEGIALESDAYNPIAGEHNRDIVKRCFNAMLNAKAETTRPPKGVGIRSTGLSWAQIKKRIIEYHAPIVHYFFSGAGLWLMRVESDVAAAVMHRLLDSGYPCLPIHDSFIVHSGLASWLEQTMEQIIEKQYGVSPTLKRKPTSRPPQSSDKNQDLYTVLEALDLPQEHRLNAHREGL